MCCYKLLGIFCFDGRNAIPDDIYIIERKSFMDKKDLLKNILADRETENLLMSELQRQLNEELSKPFKKQDFDKIEQLTSSIRSLVESEEAIKLRDECGRKYLLEKAGQKKHRAVGKFSVTLLATVLCCLTVILGLNAYSFSTWGVNFFTAVVKYTQSGVSFDFSAPESGASDDDTSEADSYGIKAKCAEYGVECETPEYIPDGLELSDSLCEELSDSTSCYFYYSNENSKLNLTIEKYNNSDAIPPVLIPNDEHDVVQKFINGKLMYILSKENSYTAVYSSGDIVYLIYTEGLGYEEFEKIINSME